MKWDPTSHHPIHLCERRCRHYPEPRAGLRSVALERSGVRMGSERKVRCRVRACVGIKQDEREIEQKAREGKEK